MFVEGARQRKVMETPHGNKVADTCALSEEVVSITLAKKSGGSTKIMVNCPDQLGLACDFTRIIVEFGLDVVGADFSTDGRWCLHRSIARRERGGHRFVCGGRTLQLEGALSQKTPVSLEEPSMQKAWRVQGLKRSLPKQKGLSFTRSGGQAVNRACEAPKGDQGRRMARYAVYGYRLWESGLQNAQSTGSWQMFSSLSPKASWSAWFTNVCLKRGLATHGHAEDQDEAMLGSESDESTSTTSSLDGFASVEDSMNENSVSENQQNLTFAPLKDEDQDSMDDEAEGLCDDVETMGEAGDFKAGSLLDVAAGDITKKANDKVQPLWLRIEQAARKKSYALETVIDSWLAEGHATSREEMIYTITALRRQGKNRRALEVCSQPLSRTTRICSFVSAG